MVAIQFMHFISRCRAQLLFAFCWVGGLLCGVATAAAMGSSALDIVHSQGSFPGIFFAVVLPFAAVAVCESRRAWVYVIAALKAFTFTFAGYVIYLTFGSAGWLAQLFLQFASICALPVFCIFCLRLLSRRMHSAKTELLIISLLMAAIAAVDAYIIAPHFIRFAVF